MAIKHCIICGKEFVDYGRGKYCTGPHHKQCVICGKEFQYDVRAQNKPKTCSSKCSGILANQNTGELKQKVCIICGNLYIPISGGQKICKLCKQNIDNQV